MDKSTHELEEIYFRLIYGKDKFEGSITFSEDAKKYVHSFVDSMMAKKRIVEEFNKVVMDEYQYRKSESSANGDESYLDFYKIRLVQEIRNLKLKKLC